MADNAWSQSTCNGDVWWWGVPGQGTHYWTARFGQYWVGGGVYQVYASVGWECGGLGPPVKPYEWLSEFNSYGQWFAGGAIYYSGGQWRIAWGDFGQTANRLVRTTAPTSADAPPDAPANVPSPPLTGLPTSKGKETVKPDRWVELYKHETGWMWRTMVDRGNLPDQMVKASGPYRWKSSAKRAAKRENPDLPIETR